MAYPDGPTGGPWHQAPAAYPAPWEQRDAAGRAPHDEAPDEAGGGAPRGSDVEPGPNGAPEPAPDAPDAPDAEPPTDAPDAPDAGPAAEPAADTPEPAGTDRPAAHRDQPAEPEDDRPAEPSDRPAEPSDRPAEPEDRPAEPEDRPGSIDDAGRPEAGVPGPAADPGTPPEPDAGAEVPAVIALPGPLRPGDLTDSPISVWDPERAEELRRRFAEAVPRFIDDPAGAVALGSSVVVEAIAALTEALRHRQDELDPARTTEHPDTESLRIALRGYRHFLERILAL